MDDPLTPITNCLIRRCVFDGKMFTHWTVLLLSLAVAVCPARTQPSTMPGPVSNVNTLIGTGSDPDDGINLFPGATMPFGMVQLSPDTEDHGVGYHYIHTRIKGFSMTHMSGPGCANEGDVFFTATTGPVVTQVVDFQSPYSHKWENAVPGYYQVELLQWGINAELSSTNRTGVARFTFPAGKSANILVPIGHTLNNVSTASVQIVGDRRIQGYVENHAFCTNKQTYKVYFVMTFSRPFASFGTWTGEHDGVAADDRGVARLHVPHGGWNRRRGRNEIGGDVEADVGESTVGDRVLDVVDVARINFNEGQYLLPGLSLGADRGALVQEVGEDMLFVPPGAFAADSRIETAGENVEFLDIGIGLGVDLLERVEAPHLYRVIDRRAGAVAERGVEHHA